MRDKCLGRHNQTPRSKKFRFAVYNGDHLMKLIDDITTLTDSLVDLFPGRPAVAKKEKELCADEVKAFTTSLKDLAEMIKDHDKILALALDEVLKPAVSPVFGALSEVLSSFHVRVILSTLKLVVMPRPWDSVRL